MNREIKFRGKNYENKWKYGDLVQEKWGQGKAIMIKKETTAWSVLEDTVGQYTGLDDKNGKKIYEGDIVKFRFKTDREEYPDLIGYIEYQTTFTAFRIMSNKGSFKIDVLDLKFIEVIGNIYDNPELLGGE